MRSLWKGYITFSLVSIPIRIYSAIEAEETVHFHQLHKKDLGRIAYEKKCKKCGEIVSNDEIVKGYEYNKDNYVILQPEDFDKVKLESTRALEIEGFINGDEVNPMYYDTPYYLGPDGKIGTHAFSLLIETLKTTNKVAVARVVMREREDMVLIAAEDKGLILYKIRYPKEIRNIEDVPDLHYIEPKKDELKLATTLVDQMSKSIDDIELTDRYQDALKDMIHAKIEGKEIKVPKKEVKPVTDIMSALKQSLEKAKAQKVPMTKAKGKKSEKPVRQRKKKTA
jgi:DNA end-binding protein Ku